MEAYDLSHKLAYAGSHSPVPFRTGPEFTNSVPVVPVLSMLRIFVEPQDWSTENVKIIAREICRVLGPTEQFDIGMTLAGRPIYDPNLPARGVIARLTKLDRNNPHVLLRVRDENGDQDLVARFPRLQFEPSGEDFWRSIVAPGLIKLPSQP